MRTQRLRIYALEERGVGDGWTRPRYTAVSSAWGRLEPPSGADLARFEGTEHTISAVVTLHWSVVVPKNGLVRVLPGGDGLADYRVVSVLARQMTGEQLVYVASLAEDERPHDVYDADLVACTQIDVEPYGPQHLQVGASVQLVVTPQDADGNPLSGRTITYTSNSANASVSADGLVVCVSSGFALITITVDGNAATGKAFYITAVAARIVVTPSPFTIVAGATQTLAVTIYDANSNVITPSYTLVSGDPSIATISGNVVTGVSGGEVVIIAQAGAALGGAIAGVVA